MFKKKWYGGLTKGTLARRGGCGAEALGASTALWAIVVEALPDGAHRGVRGEGGLFVDRGSFGFQNKNSVRSE